MDTISYAYADEAHDRINELQEIVTKSGDVITLTGDVIATSTVLPDGSIALETTIDGNNIESIRSMIDDAGEIKLVTESTNTGYILKNQDRENYGIIGNYAIDLSFSSDLYSQNGATGDYSFATGEGVIAQNRHSFASGKFNLPKETSIVEIGVGEDNNNRKNALEIHTDGKVLAPELTKTKIVEGGGQSLVTKQYIDDLIIDCGTF